MPPVKSNRTSSTSRFIFGPATPNIHSHLPSAPSPNYFTSRFCPEIRIQLVQRNALTPLYP